MPSLRQHHTFHLPASGRQVIPFTSPESFRAQWLQSEINYLLGGGSNTIFLEDFDGQVFINEMRGIEHKETDSHHLLRVAGGENWHELVSFCLNSGWYGLENLALIPGSVGASPIQNIGAYGVEVGQFIASVEVMDIESGNLSTLKNAECQFGYRDSVFKHALAGKVLITHVNFALPKDYQPVVSYGELAALENPTAQQVFDTVIAVRKAKLPDPDELGNAGSFFKNPVVSESHFERLKKEAPTIPGFVVDGGVKVPAAWLIDQSGYKGKVEGGVRCHFTQPLVLTNTGDAVGQDVVTLARNIMDSIRTRYDIALEAEVRLVGRDGVITL